MLDFLSKGTMFMVYFSLSGCIMIVAPMNGSQTGSRKTKIPCVRMYLFQASIWEGAPASHDVTLTKHRFLLVGGFNPFENY